MPIDGCFVHHLVNELNDEILHFKINKVYQPNPLDVLLQLRGKNKNGLIVNKQLLISSRLDHPRIHLTDHKYLNPELPSSFCMLLRKYIERGEIKEINQHHNDRIIELHILTYNELDDEMKFILIFELMGRNSNIILVNSSFTIIDAIRKLPPSNESLRTIIPHAMYVYPSSDKLNPFNNSMDNLNNLEGVSLPLKHRLEELKQDDRHSFISENIKPVIYKNNQKHDVYFKPLHEDDEIIYCFDSLSKMLEKHFEDAINTTNFDASMIEKVVKKRLKHALNKKDNLNTDLNIACNNLTYNDLGILLQANLYKVKKGDTFINVYNFLNQNEEVTIELDPLKDASKNLSSIFQKGKKAKNAILEINKQIELIDQEIEYLEDILFQLSIGNHTDIEEIKTDLANLGYLSKSKRKIRKQNQIKLTKYLIDDLVVYVGKNNIQNDYLTHKIASSNDIFFHAKDMPGSHVVLKVPNNDPNFVLSEACIRGCAMLASYFSKGKNSNSVPVDYTKVRNLKKIPGLNGSKVIITSQKTIYIDPDESFVKEHETN